MRFLAYIAYLSLGCGPGVSTVVDGGGGGDADPDACDRCVCEPGTGTCEGDISHACKADGSGYEDIYCDPEQGMRCGPEGVCVGVCPTLESGQTYFGCEYWPTVTGNLVANTFDFAVVVVNTWDWEATVTIEGGALTDPDVFTVAEDSAVVRYLPWVDKLKLCSSTEAWQCQSGQPTAALVVDGAYHLRADVPVTVYQFNPIQYAEQGTDTYSYSNDASLLFPASAWRTDHVVAVWHDSADVHQGLLTVTASQDDTQVTITTTTDTVAAQGAPAFEAGVPQTVTLSAGDVLEIGSIVGDVVADDLTGTRIVSNKPVQVIGGHYCANVPDGVGYCDHLEEVMPPIDALGAEYIVASPAVPLRPNGNEQVVRIVATEPGTTLAYDPPQATFPTSIAAAGEWVEIAPQTASYKLIANKKVLVMQYMVGAMASFGTGDPAMAFAVPVGQFRTDYLFHAPTNYEINAVNVVAPTGVTIMLDGVPVTGWQAIGTSGWQVARVMPLGPGPLAGGNHQITGNMAFGISVYGYGAETSYWYPGGLDLRAIIVE